MILALLMSLQSVQARPIEPVGWPGPGGQNVLLIVLDDIGIETLSAYGIGASPAPTPNLDQLAAEGIVFEYAYANPICSPTRATIQSGRYGFRTGIGEVVREDNMGLPLTEILIPRMLDLAGLGYSHAMLGKWHLSNQASGSYSARNFFGYQHFAGTEGNLIPGGYFDWFKIVNGDRFATTHYATSDVADDCLSWIATASEPWFVCASFHAAHAPLHRPPNDLHSFHLHHPEPGPGDDPRLYFLAMIEALDTELGRIFAALDEQTTILVVGDNGTPGAWIDAPFDPLRGKGTVYEGGIRVPLIVKSPLVQEPGARVPALVNTTDLFATVAELAGADLDSLGLPALDSVSIIPYLGDPGAAPRRSMVFSEIFNPNGFDPLTREQAIRNGRYKLIRRSKTVEEEFYDLQADPYETQPLDIDDLDPSAQQAYDELAEALADLAAS